jgi:hypothetical protein
MMKMKRIIYCLVILGIVLTGCNPVEDIYKEVDKVDRPIVGEATYTLTSDNYTDDIEDGGLGRSFANFGSEDEAKAELPAFLDGLFPTWGEGSAVLVGYDLFIGNAEGVSDYSGADIYELTNADYASTGSDAFGFYPTVDANDYIPGILDAAITSPAEGDIILAKFDQYFNDPEVGLANVYSASFPANFGDFENIDVLGAEGWSADTGYALGTGYDGAAFANEDWLISPEIDLTGMTNLKFQINQEIDFFGADPSAIDILVSTDYITGTDPMAATWTVFDFDKTIYGSMTLSEDFDFTYGGATVHVAFKYTSTDAVSARWRVESFAIKALGVDGEANNKGTHFVYDDGEWEAADGVYFLSTADFDSMGEGSGQPGRFNNFGSSTPAEDYLPTFLSITAPWAYGLDDDEVIMVYDYFSSSSGAQIRGNRYTKINGEWTAHERIISTTLQFGHDGDSWVPDNTIRYTFDGADVSFISDAFITIYPGPADNVGFFGSFDRRSGSSNFWSDDMLLEAFNALLESGGFVTDEGQKYVLTYVIYNGSTTDETKSVIKTGGVWVYQE